MSKSKFNTRYLVVTAMLSAVAFVLMFLEFPIPALIPAFIKMDLSDLPALIGSFSMGPLSGIIISLLKNLLHILIKGTSSGGIGELANFMMGAVFSALAGLIYKLHKTKATALVGGIVGSVVMGIVAAFANYFILLPLFEQFMPVDQIIASFGEFLPFIKTKLDVVLYNAFPFNLLKGLVITAFTMLIYKRIRPLLKGKE